MTEDTPDDVESYQKELSESLDDGGGCAEMWEALSSARSRDDRLPRRTMLRRVAGALGVTVAGLSGMVDVAIAATEAVDVEEVDGRVRRKLVSRAFADPRVRAVTREFLEQGYRPQVRDARGTTSRLHESRLPEEVKSKLPDDREKPEEWAAVVIPFGPTDDGEQVDLTWTTSPSVEYQVVGRRSEYVTPADGGEPFWEIETYIADERGHVSVETDVMANFLGCDNPDTGCIALIAAAYGAEFIACFTCGFSAGWLIPACGYCITAVLAAYGTSATCDWCND